MLELLLLLPFVIVHLAPEVFFIQEQYLPSIFIATCANERSLLLKYTPWPNSRFCAASALPIIIPYLSSPIRACAKPQAGVGPPRRSPPCILYGYDLFLLRDMGNLKSRGRRKLKRGNTGEHHGVHRKHLPWLSQNKEFEARLQLYVSRATGTLAVLTPTSSTRRGARCDTAESENLAKNGSPADH